MKPLTDALVVAALKVTGDEQRVLLDVAQVTFNPGMLHVINGPSGSGKSTLIHALAGLSESVSGSVTWRGEDVLSLSNAGRAAFRLRQLGLVFQDALLFEGLSATANASISASFARSPQRKTILQNATATLQALGLTAISKRGAERYSGGERQRVAMARALANDPPIVLADEPTASLDRDMADRVINELWDLAAVRNKLVIVASHDRELHQRADRLFHLESGHLHEVAR